MSFSQLTASLELTADCFAKHSQGSIDLFWVSGSSAHCIGVRLQTVFDLKSSLQGSCAAEEEHPTASSILSRCTVSPVHSLGCILGGRKEREESVAVMLVIFLFSGSQLLLFSGSHALTDTPQNVCDKRVHPYSCSSVWMPWKRDKSVCFPFGQRGKGPQVGANDERLFQGSDPDIVNVALWGTDGGYGATRQ